MGRGAFWFLGASVLFLNMACNRAPVTRERVLRVPMNPWGTAYSFPTIHDRPLAEQEMAKAVFLIQRAEGGGASGFFISEDGLALTNEHVFSRSQCSKTCQGYRLIRHFTPNGAFEVYSKFEILAHSSSSDLDFALIKVTLPPGKKVPYLKLKDDSTPPFGSGHLRLLGHPALASLRSSEASPLSSTTRHLVMRGPITGGNSGGPIVDTDRQEVIGVAQGYAAHKQYVNRMPFVVFTMGAIAIKPMRMAVARLYPRTNGVKQWNVSLFDDASKPARADRPMDLEPKDRENDFFDQPIADPRIVLSQFMDLGDPAKERQALEKFANEVSHRSTGSLDVKEQADTLLEAALARDEKLEMADVDFQKFLALASTEDRAKLGSLDALEIMQDPSKQSACQTKVGKLGLMAQLFFAGEACLSTTLPGGGDVLEALISRFPGGKGKPVLLGAPQIILRQARLRRLTGDATSGEVKAAMQMLQTIFDHSGVPETSLSAEGLFTLLQHDAGLLVRGSYRDSFLN